MTVSNFRSEREHQGFGTDVQRLTGDSRIRIGSHSSQSLARYYCCCRGQYRHTVYAMTTPPPPPPDREIKDFHGEASEGAGADCISLKEAGNRAFAKGNLEEAYTVRLRICCFVCVGSVALHTSRGLYAHLYSTAVLL